MPLKIRTYNQIAPRGLEVFPAKNYTVGAEVADPDAILLRSHRLQAADLGDKLRAIARAGAGTNNIPVADCTQRGIVVFNTPGANANAVKELVLCGMLLASRGIIQGIGFANNQNEIKDYATLAKLMEQEKKRFAGSEIAGKTLGVVGLGAIGSLVAETAINLGMKVQGYDPGLSVDGAWRLPNQVIRCDNLQSLVASSHFITLHLPVLDSTRGLINRDLFRAMGADACLLNFARDEIVDAAALDEALTKGTLGKYVCDFPRPELIGRDNVIAMPHLGASTQEAEENCAVMAAAQLHEFLQHGNIRNSVNYPALFLERAADAPTGARLAVSNRNVPTMLGQITSVLAEHKINVLDMLNKSRDDIAYNLIDLESAPPAAVLKSIANIKHVVKVSAL